MKSLGEILSINKTLTVLDISYTDIGSDGCQYLADCRNISLSELIMTSCKLGVSGADKIGQMIHYNKAISSVHLDWNEIGDNGVEKLVGQFYTTLKHLNLRSNGIGAIYLNKGLLTTHCSSLCNIELSGTPLGDNGVDIILQSLTITMEHVGLVGTGMPDIMLFVSTKSSTQCEVYQFYCTKCM
ncbi:protein NLRC3-like [Dysidea avara]|uniref:protein NLRC3-like n=1 Tax=Dysidea avara TaxID=196820 RepID=UPI00332ACED2